MLPRGRLRLTRETTRIAEERWEPRQGSAIKGMAILASVVFGLFLIVAFFDWLVTL